MPVFGEVEGGNGYYMLVYSYSEGQEKGWKGCLESYQPAAAVLADVARLDKNGQYACPCLPLPLDETYFHSTKTVIVHPMIPCFRVLFHSFIFMFTWQAIVLQCAA